MRQQACILLALGLLGSTFAEAREPDAAIELFQASGDAICNLEFRGAVKPPPKAELMRLMETAMSFCVTLAPTIDISGSVEHDDTNVDTLGAVPMYDHRTKRTRMVPYDQVWAGAKKITGHD